MHTALVTFYSWLYGGVDYKEIPTYTATRVDPEVREPSGEFDLRDSVDFRPRVADATLNTSTTNQNQTLTKVTSMSFDFISREHLMELVLLHLVFQKTIQTFNMILNFSW